MTCPWQALRDPFVIAVIESHRWWKERQLAEHWGGVIPYAIDRGVGVYDNALRAVIAHDQRVEMERRERENAQAMDRLAGPRPLHRRR